MDQAGRLESLDGLRGIACLVVLLMHLGLTVKPLGGGSYALMPGNEAVLVFFVLSGVVLSIKPFSMRSISEYPWYGYFPRRVIRLMVPLFVAVFLGVVFVLGAQFLGLSATGGALETINVNDGIRVLMHDVVEQFDFLFSDVDRSNPPAWSMKWELWFSIALPLCIYVASRTRRDSIAVIVIFIAIFISCFVEYSAIRLCLMFVLGVYLAKHLKKIHSLHMPPVLTLVLFVVAIVLTELSALQRCGYLDTGNAILDSGVGVLCGFGCMLLVFLAISPGLVNRLLATRPCLFFGKLSYSLYLTHALVVAGLHAVLNLCGLTDPFVQCVAIILTSLLVAYGFWALVEKPSIEWSRRVGRDASEASVPVKE